MQRLSKYAKSLMVCVLATVMLSSSSAYAMEDIAVVDSSSTASLTISFVPEDTPTSGVEFRLYQVAELSEEDEYTVTPTFADYPVVIPGADAETNRQLATTLPGYIAADNIDADYAGITNEEGNVSFEEMNTGMYMVMGDTAQDEEEYVLPTPFMLELNGDVVTSCKFMSRLRTETVSIEVLKVWKDDDYSGRPKEVTIELYGGNELYDTVVLSKENNWRYEWTGLNSGLFWSTKEKEVPDGYTVSVEQQGERLVINNTRVTPPVETNPPKETTPPEATDSPQETNPPEVTDPPKGTASPTATNSPSTTNKPSATNAPSVTNSPTTEKPVVPSETPAPTVPTLPQTGMLWWPVPVLLIAGGVLILLGLLRRRGGEDEE